MTEQPTETPEGDGRDGPGLGEKVRTTLVNAEFERGRIGLWMVALLVIAGLAYVGWTYVGTLTVGVFVYYVTRPVFRRVHTHIESRALAVAATLLVAALPILVLVGWALAILVNVLSEFLNSERFVELETLLAPYLDLTETLAEMEAQVAQFLADPTQLPDVDLGAVLGQVTDTLGSALGVFVNVGLHGFIVLIIVFYLLKDDYRVAAWSRRTFLTEGGVLERYFETVDHDLHNVYFGNILNALMTGLLAAVVYTLLNFVAPAGVGIPESAFLGLLVGAASLIPVIGIKIVTWPVGGYLLAVALLTQPEAVWFPVLFLLVSFVVVDYIPDQLLRPYVSGRTLHVGAVMLAYTLGPLLFGWFGIFLAPLLFVLVFEFGRIVFPWLVDPTVIPGAPADGERPGREAADSTPEPSDLTEEPSEVGDGPRLPGSTEPREPSGGE
jgi:predicted PurR-regulated permease PerM